jgi:hypothetical protein
MTCAVKFGFRTGSLISLSRDRSYRLPYLFLKKDLGFHPSNFFVNWAPGTIDIPTESWSETGIFRLWRPENAKRGARDHWMICKGIDLKRFQGSCIDRCDSTDWSILYRKSRDRVDPGTKKHAYPKRVQGPGAEVWGNNFASLGLHNRKIYYKYQF